MFEPKIKKKKVFFLKNENIYTFEKKLLSIAKKAHFLPVTVNLALWP